METASNMFSLLEDDAQGSAIINTAKEERKQNKLKEQEEREQKIWTEKQKKLKEQEERERKQSALANVFMEALPFKFSHHQRRPPNRRKQDQNHDAKDQIEGSKKDAKDHGEGFKKNAKDHGEGSNVSEKDQGSDAKQPSSSDHQKSNLSEKDLGGDGAEKVDDDRKENGAEGGNVVAAADEQKDSKKKKANKSEVGDKSVKSDKMEEDYRNVMTLAEYEKELEKRKALKSDEKTDQERNETLDNALELDQKTEEIKVTPDEDFESMQLLQKENEDDDLFIHVVSKHVKRTNRASQKEGQRHNGGSQREYRTPNGHPRLEGKRTNSGYWHESRRPNGGQQFINGERHVDAPRYQGERPHRPESWSPNVGQQFNGERPKSGNGGHSYNGERPNSSQGHGVDGKKPYGGIGESKGPNGDQGERPSFGYRRGDGGKGRIPNSKGLSANCGRNGPVPALSLKDKKKFPDFEDANQFPALGGARKA